MTGGIEVPSMEPEPAAAPEPAAKPASRRKATAKAKGGGLPATLGEVEALLASLRTEAAELNEKFFQSAAHRSAAPALEAAARDGRREEHLRDASTAAYRVSEIAGLTGILTDAKRLLESAELDAEADAISGARDKADAAAKALGLDATRTAEAAKAIRRYVGEQADALRARAEHARRGVKLDIERVDLRDESTWPASAQQDVRYRRAAKLAAIEEAARIA